MVQRTLMRMYAVKQKVGTNWKLIHERWTRGVVGKYCRQYIIKFSEVSHPAIGFNFYWEVITEKNSNPTHGEHYLLRFSLNSPLVLSIQHSSRSTYTHTHSSTHTHTCTHTHTSHTLPHTFTHSSTYSSTLIHAHIHSHTLHHTHTCPHSQNTHTHTHGTYILRFQDTDQVRNLSR